MNYSIIIVQVRYSTIETKEVAVLYIMGFVFHIRTQVKALVPMRKNKPVISNTGNFFCFNSNVSYT
jgi:hypothetical protein